MAYEMPQPCDRWRGVSREEAAKSVAFLAAIEKATNRRKSDEPKNGRSKSNG